MPERIMSDYSNLESISKELEFNNEFGSFVDIKHLIDSVPNPKMRNIDESFFRVISSQD